MEKEGGMHAAAQHMEQMDFRHAKLGRTILLSEALRDGDKRESERERERERREREKQRKRETVRLREEREKQR
jgi:hypothetical protein